MYTYTYLDSCACIHKYSCTYHTDQKICTFTRINTKKTHPQYYLCVNFYTWCVSIRVHIWADRHVYMYTYMYTYINTYQNAFRRVASDIDKYIISYIYTHDYIIIWFHDYHTRVNANTHIDTHTLSHTHTYTHTCTHTFIHMRSFLKNYSFLCMCVFKRRSQGLIRQHGPCLLW